MMNRQIKRSFARTVVSRGRESSAPQGAEHRRLWERFGLCGRKATRPGMNSRLPIEKCSGASALASMMLVVSLHKGKLIRYPRTKHGFALRDTTAPKSHKRR